MKYLITILLLAVTIIANAQSKVIIRLEPDEVGIFAKITNPIDARYLNCYVEVIDMKPIDLCDYIISCRILSTGEVVSFHEEEIDFLPMDTECDGSTIVYDVKRLKVRRR